MKMPVRITETPNGYVCSNHPDKKIVFMLSSVPIPKGCEECIRAAFAEALEVALQESRESTNQNR
jgi:hypothetical protein